MISSLELARLCGVSQGTVDRALHGRPGVSARTRERIEAVAREHGYRPHPAARELLSGKSQVLGVIMPTSNAVFFQDLVLALKSAGDEFGLRLGITPVSNETEFLGALEDFAARRVRGVIAVPPSQEIMLPPGLSGAIPIATLLSPLGDSAIPLFAPDEQTTGETAVAYLAGLDHRRILHLAYARRAFAIEERRHGYTRAMTTRGLEPHAVAFEGADELLEAVRTYQPTAIFCHNDWLALAVIRILSGAGLRVPEDISVLGVDNSPTFNEFQADITTLAYPEAEVARKTVQWIATGVDERPTSPLHVVEKRTVQPCS